MTTSWSICLRLESEQVIVSNSYTCEYPDLYARIQSNWDRATFLAHAWFYCGKNVFFITVKLISPNSSALAQFVN